MQPNIYLAETETKGRGVFAARPIPVGDTIEICPVIVLPEDETALINQTHLYNYYFGWSEDLTVVGIALGLGSIYNHSYQPNAQYLKHFSRAELEFVALRDIAQGEEITVNYNHEPTNLKKVWFETVD